MTVLITLTTAGADTGPFTLYSNVDGYVTPFASGVSKGALVAGYTSYVVPNGTEIIRVISAGACTNYTDINVYTTTTTTTTSADPLISTLTFTGYESGVFTFTLSDAIYSNNVVVTNAYVQGSNSSLICADLTIVDNFNLENLTITAGATTGVKAGQTPFTCVTQSVKRGTSIYVNGAGPLVDGSSTVVGTTTVMISIPSSCIAPYVCSTYTAISVLKGTSTSICGVAPTTIYVAFGESITTGTYVYTDSALTIPLTGYYYIADATYGNVYEINSTTGVIGVDTGISC